MLLLFFLLYSKQIWGTVFCIVYLSGIVISASTSEVEYDERLFVPIYPLLIVTVAEAHMHWEKKRVLWYIGQGLGVAWCGYVAFRFVKNAIFWF